MRFFGMVRTLSRESLIRLCHLDYDRELALIAVHQDAAGRPHLAGVSRYYLRPETGTAEFALVVGDAWHRKGIGTHLMQRLIAIASERGVRHLVGSILRENGPMLSLMKKLGFKLSDTADESVIRAELSLVRTP
jgi:acetyltransferase